MSKPNSPISNPARMDDSQTPEGGTSAGRPSTRASDANAVGAETPDPPHKVPAVQRATAILWHLASHGDGLRVARIARDLGILPSTCLHILRELTAAHLVAFEPNGKTYRLGLGVLGLARELSSHDVFIQAAQPRLTQFARDYSVSASAQQRDGDSLVVVATATANEGIVMPVGVRAPCLTAAVGLVFAAYSAWTPPQLEVRFKRVRWQNPPDFDSWMNDVRATRKRGYAMDKGRWRLGITSIAAPIPDKTGNVTRTMSVNVVSAQLDSRRLERFIQALKQTSASISMALQ